MSTKEKAMALLDLMNGRTVARTAHDVSRLDRIRIHSGRRTG